MEGRITKSNVIIPQTEQWLTYSKINHLPYQILVSIPKQPAPPAGYPVIYVLDGNAFFQSFQEVIRLQSVRSEKTGIAPAIIVGIGYPEAEDFVTARRVYDFTPPAASVDLPPRPDGSPWPEAGGAHFFYQFIQEEFIPEINRRYPIDLQRQMLFGHSLGGLFTLYALFTKPAAFQTYVASSPSIWWNKRNIYEHENLFFPQLAQVNQKRGVFLAVGALEKDYMIKETKELADRLVQLNNPKLNVAFQQLEGENHISVVPTILSRALRFSFEQG
ncbi:alpha/beta hydrolase [Neobacillus muris]|uniref:alpha/beta hydrolase n=1 Tax=Neobacillus muris TaxID=2941334 RepID=UPI00203CD058|nr:alpha/beta hydrolase-fold protein [Neobacillus muris]